MDPSGVTDDGFRFVDFRDFKQHLIGSTDGLARNLVSKLIEFSTGGEIEFSDRKDIERILDMTRDDGYLAHDANANTPLCNLFVSLLNKTGIDSERFGTSTGTLDI